MKKRKKHQELIAREKRLLKKKLRRKRQKKHTSKRYNSYGERESRQRLVDIARSMKLQNHLANHRYEDIVFPEYFSLIRNSQETLPVFDPIIEKAHSGIPIRLSMQHVKQIGVESLLYLISTIDRIKHSQIDYWLAGSAPENEECREVFIQSGFLKFVKHKRNFNINYDKDYYQIQSGNIVDPAIAKQVAAFTQKHLELSRKHIFGLYRMLIELMCNTKEHAYPPQNGSSLTKWYIIAQHDKINKFINFCFLDTGVGIPSTVTKSRPEILMGVALSIAGPGGKVFSVTPTGMFEFLSTHNSDLIESTLKGAFRTRTGQSYRGKGLPCIYGFSEAGYIEDLVVISHKGFVECLEVNKKAELNNSFFGTMYSWRISRKNAIDKSKFVNISI